MRCVDAVTCLQSEKKNTDSRATSRGGDALVAAFDRVLAKIGNIFQNFANFFNFLVGSFSAVSKPNFARKNIPALRAKQGYTQRRAAPS